MRTYYTSLIHCKNDLNFQSDFLNSPEDIIEIFKKYNQDKNSIWGKLYECKSGKLIFEYYHNNKIETPEVHKINDEPKYWNFCPNCGVELK